MPINIHTIVQTIAPGIVQTIVSVQHPAETATYIAEFHPNMNGIVKLLLRE